MYGGSQIWPTNEARITSISLDLTSLAGTADHAYWLHAIDAVSNGSTPGQYMKLTVGSRVFLVNSTFGSYNLATFSLGAFQLGKNGPLLQDVRPGDMVSINAVIPDRYDDQYRCTNNPGHGEFSWTLPWLPSTKLYLRLEKYQKKQNSLAFFTLSGSPSDTTHLYGYIQKQGHNRDTVTSEASATIGSKLGDGRVLNADKSLIPGDTSMICSISDVNTTVYLKPHYPSFERSWQFPISSITTSES